MRVIIYVKKQGSTQFKAVNQNLETVMRLNNAYIFNADTAAKEGDKLKQLGYKVRYRQYPLTTTRKHIPLFSEVDSAI